MWRVILSMQGKKKKAPLSHCIFHITSNKTHQFCLWNSLLWFSSSLYYIKIHLPIITENHYSQQMYTFRVLTWVRTTNMWRNLLHQVKWLLLSWHPIFIYICGIFIILCHFFLILKINHFLRHDQDGFIFDSSDSNYVSKSYEINRSLF